MKVGLLLVCRAQVLICFPRAMVQSMLLVKPGNKPPVDSCLLFQGGNIVNSDNMQIGSYHITC